MEIKLIALEESDFSRIIDWVNSHSEDFIVQWAGLTYQYPLTLEQMKTHYSRGINSYESDVFIFKIMLNDVFIGTVQLCRFNQELKEAVVGRFLIEDANRGQGIGKKTLLELVRMGFRDFGLSRIKLNVFDFNKQAIACYESIGFSKTLYREKIYQDQSGLWWDNIEMTLTKEYWERRSNESLQ